MTYCVLGISCGFHDSATCITSLSGELLFASSEERFTRIKGDKTFPKKALLYAIDFAKSQGLKIQFVCFHENPFHGYTSSKWWLPGEFIDSRIKKIKNITRLTDEISEISRSLSIPYENIFFSEHHDSHAYASIGSSRIGTGLVVILDAIGGKYSGIIGCANDYKLTEYEKIPISKSLGLIYSCITVYCGFKVLTGEYKLMGLAPYGRPIYKNILVEVFGDPLKGETNISDISYTGDLFSKDSLIVYHFHIESKKTLKYYSVTQILPQVCSFTLKKQCGIIKEGLAKFKLSSKQDIGLYLGGGVGLNCKSNLILAEKFSEIFKEVWCFPASGDAGSSYGACVDLAVRNGTFKSPYSKKIGTELITVGASISTKRSFLTTIQYITKNLMQTPSKKSVFL